MDSNIEVVASAPAREVLRDSRGTIVGILEQQRLVGKILLRDARGTILGSFDARSDTTRDASGRLVGRDNLSMLLKR